MFETRRLAQMAQQANVALDLHHGMHSCDPEASIRNARKIVYWTVLVGLRQRGTWTIIRIVAGDIKQLTLSATRSAAPRIAPLTVRKSVVKVLNRVPGRQKEGLILALLNDWAAREPSEYHQFIWSNHLSYAQYYDFRQIRDSRGAYFERLHPLRAELFEMVAADLRDDGLAPESDVTSFLDVGASLGYLPRYAETTMFPAARRLLGVDIDAYAVAEGAAYLRSVGSAVELKVAEIGRLDDVIGTERFDVVMCTGVLQYLDQEAAARAVRAMLGLASMRLALSGLAANLDNATLSGSQVRPYDGSFIHNFDRMITDNGGRIVARRWGGRELIEGLGAYLIVATAS